jgi:hypothetical protein
MGQGVSVSSQWTFAPTRDNQGEDCAILYNVFAKTVIELHGSSDGWFSFMDRGDEKKILSSSDPTNEEHMGKYCGGMDATHEPRVLRVAPTVMTQLRSGDGTLLRPGWRLGNWSAMEEAALIILRCDVCPDLRLVLTGAGFVLFAGGGDNALVVRNNSVRAVPPNIARREVVEAQRVAGEEGCCSCCCGPAALPPPNRDSARSTSSANGVGGQVSPRVQNRL